MRKLGKILVIIGLLVIAFYYTYNKSIESKDNDDMNNYIEETSITEEMESQINEETKVSDIQSDSNIVYTAVLEIPKINLKRGVVDSTRNFKSINYAISVDNNSNYPNEKGNFILYSHSGNSSIAFFHKLNKVEIDDDIYVYYNGTKYHYVVYEKYDIEKTGKAKIISKKDNNYITLITCNQSKKGYQIVVLGKLIDTVNY